VLGLLAVEKIRMIERYLSSQLECAASKQLTETAVFMETAEDQLPLQKVQHNEKNRL
jgi:hypothetical protein